MTMASNSPAGGCCLYETATCSGIIPPRRETASRTVTLSSSFPCPGTAGVPQRRRHAPFLEGLRVLFARESARQRKVSLATGSVRIFHRGDRKARRDRPDWPFLP
jgi:hypothetical protein